MNLVVPAVLLAVVAGYSGGGRLRNLGDVRIRWPHVAAAGLVLQLIIFAAGVAAELSLLLSFVLLTIAAVANVGRPGFSLILVGVLANFLVIATNHGMPVSLHAVVASAQVDTLPRLLAGDARHHLLGSGDRLVFLADVVAIGRPVGAVVSAGDLAMYAGVVVAIARGMGGWSLRHVPAVPETAA